MFTEKAINFFLLIFHSKIENAMGKKTYRFMEHDFMYLNGKDIFMNF